MKALKMLRSTVSAMALGAAVICTPALAGFTAVVEGPDAGDTLATAFDARVPGHLRISGSLSAEPATLDYVDMYRLDLSTLALTASTGDGTDSALIADPVLYLFDATGRGVAMDDEGGGFGQALLRLVSTVLVGDYYLAIAFGGVEAVDALGGSIFDTFGTGAVNGTAGALAGWLGGPFSPDPALEGRYGVSLQVPAPGTLALVALGLVPLLRRRTNRPAPAGALA